MIEINQPSQSQASYLIPAPKVYSNDSKSNYDSVHTRIVKDSIYNEGIEFQVDLFKYIDNPVYARTKNLY